MRGVRLYNSLTRQVGPLVVRDPGALTWYACGPTVYDDAHVGHARAYVSQDIARRVFSSVGGLDVTLVQGVTDVDNKIFARAQERGIDWKDLARTYEGRFWEDMDALDVQRPDIIVRVTSHVADMVSFTESIVRNGHGYVAPSGSVYFDVRSMGDRYGRLRPVDASDADADDGDASEKRSRHDFALWKSSIPSDPVSWPSPWGPGRPGWHIECSAMSSCASFLCHSFL